MGSPSVRQKVRDAGFTPNLTPLLDVVLQLITFFMMLVHFGTRIEGATDLVRLPVAPAALPTTDMELDTLAIAVDVDGRLLVGSTAYNPDQAARWFRDQAAARRSARGATPPPRVDGEPASELGTLVILRADRDASTGAVRRVMAAARREGFVRFSLIVLRQPIPEDPRPATLSTPSPSSPNAAGGGS